MTHKTQITTSSGVKRKLSSPPQQEESRNKRRREHTYINSTTEEDDNLDFGENEDVMLDVETISVKDLVDANFYNGLHKNLI